MNNKNNKQPMSKKSTAIMWIIIAAVMVFAAASDGDAVIPAVLTLVLTTVIIAISAAVNKKQAGKNPAPSRTARPEPVRTAPERTEASKLRARRSFWICAAVIAILIFALLPKELLMDTLRLFERYGFQRALHILWRAERGRIYGLLIFTVLALVAVIGLARAAALSRRIAREPDNIPADRPARAAVRAPEREEAISCAHHTGKEKYIGQLDSYLKAGLIDKAEYRALKERYSKLDIPEDYH